MDYQSIIEKIYREVGDLLGKGKVASYISPLAAIDANKIGIAVASTNGNMYTIGNADEQFSIQSISKVFTLVMAFQELGEQLWSRVGKEPSGNAFNSLVHLEYENGKPRNPFVNGGALVVSDILTSLYKHTDRKILEFVRLVSANPDIKINEAIAKAEYETADRNFALAYFIKSYENITNNIDLIMQNYTRQCAVEMSCIDLAKAFLFLANHGIDAHSKRVLLTRSQAKRVNSIMMTSGLYNESGDFAFRVGMPAKSGVGGGIVGIIPQHLAIACWSPELNQFGNSLIGIEIMERFTSYSGISIF